MKPSPRNSIQANCNFQKFIVFDIDSYRFASIRKNKSYDFVKTCINRKLTQQQLQIITKFHHKNIIALKKISKVKRNNQQLFWLYYEAVPFTIQQAFQQANININPLSLQLTLQNISNYAISQKIFPQITYQNIGVNEYGDIKIYLSAQMILKCAKNFKQLSLVDQKIKQVLIYYRKKYNQRRAHQIQLPNSQLKNQIMPNAAKVNKNQDYKITYEYKPSTNVANQIKAQNKKCCLQSHQNGKSPFNSTSFKQKKLIQPLANKDEISLIKLKQTTEKKIQTKNAKQQQQNNLNKGIYQVFSPTIFNNDFDTQSVDTYQMQMGEDFEMPSVRTNQKLRQTLVNSKHSWDMLTYKTNTKANNFHESAGAKNFKTIIDKNKEKIHGDKKQKQFDNKTMHDNKNLLNGKSWQTSTIKSTLASNIQDKIQHALTKTRRAMEMLNRAKSSPPKK